MPSGGIDQWHYINFTSLFVVISRNSVSRSYPRRCRIVILNSTSDGATLQYPCNNRRPYNQFTRIKLHILHTYLSTLLLVANENSTRLNLSRFPLRESTLDGRWKRKPFGILRVQPILFYLNVPALRRYMSSLFLSILTILASTQSADNMFHSFTVLCKKKSILLLC